MSAKIRLLSDRSTRFYTKGNLWERLIIFSTKMKTEIIFLGLLCISIGGKIIFFPGVSDRRLVRSAEGEEILAKGIVHDIDHISLEGNLRNYHVTMKQKEREGARYPKRNTILIKDEN